MLTDYRIIATLVVWEDGLFYVKYRNRTEVAVKKTGITLYLQIKLNFESYINL